jgi:branched-chain amino acid transport system ATP-binding protein
MKPHEVAMLGVTRLFQVPRVFRNLTVMQNLLVPTIPLKGRGWMIQRAEEMLKRVGLIDMKDQLAGHLSRSAKDGGDLPSLNA